MAAVLKLFILDIRTCGGVIRKKYEPKLAVAPTLMWVKAMDMLLDKLRVCGVDFGRVAAISGCAQVKKKSIERQKKCENNALQNCSNTELSTGVKVAETTCRRSTQKNFFTSN